MGDRFRYGQRLYRIWIEMRRRCRDEHRDSYCRYGGRGITVCPEWQDYEVFARWALSNGYADDLTIERIDVNGNYCPENCTWITRGAQARNRRNNFKVTISGETKTGAEWARDAGLEKHTVINRIRKGLNPETAVTKQGPVRKRSVFGEELTLKEMEEKYGIKTTTIKSRIRKGMTPEEAVLTPLKKDWAVIQETTDGCVVRKWKCANEAVRELGYSLSGISDCCTGRIKTYKGYVWRYEKDTK